MKCSFTSFISSVTAMSIADTPSMFGILPSPLYVSSNLTMATFRWATAICMGVLPELSFALGDALYFNKSRMLVKLLTRVAKWSGVAWSTLLQIWFAGSLTFSR